MNILITEDNYFEKIRLIKFVQNYRKDLNVVCFDNFQDSITYARENCVDLALLDIKIHDDDGYILAKELKELNKNTEICFVSGYSDNAINAFKLDAIGFIEKPYDFEDVSKVLDRFMSLPRENEKSIFIKTFGKFEIYVNNQLINFSSAKSKEFLAFLVNNLGETVSLEEIVSNVFGEETENGYNYLRIIFHRLNKTLKDQGIEKIIGHQKNNYYVNLREFQCDLQEVMNGNSAFYTLYHGSYMEGYKWAENFKQKLEVLINKKIKVG